METSWNQCLCKMLLVSVALLWLFGSGCSAIRLNPDGGYDIVVGVESNTIEPKNVNDFMGEIRAGIDQFSNELWKATKRRFYINSVDVLVPGNWWTLSNFEYATWQTLHHSEFRIARDVAAPNVVNPNPCGTSGLYIELPDNFFADPRGQYGLVGKALVNLWARYRFGVWEEHGIPGDTKFPYFYSRPSYEPKWEATGCSNEEILGNFRTITGEESDRCDHTGTKSPDDDCRFSPSSSNTANSSLLHFHWLDSVTEFCDSKTHNHAAPNRHNLLCGHRSVWEVIRESDDYKFTKSCTDEVPRPKYRALKETRTPEFYILLDRGNTVTPEKVLKEVKGALTTFLQTPSIEKLSTAVGTYPHPNLGRDHYYVKEEVEWSPIATSFYDIEKVLTETEKPEGPVIRDFGLAIQEVVEKIKQRNHLAGTVLFIVKRGAGQNTFDKIAYEQEVIASIKEDHRIKVFAIEMQQGEQMPYTNLQSLVEATQGLYHLINDTTNTAKKMEVFLSNMQQILEQSSIMNGLNNWVIQKQYTVPDKSIEIPIYDDVPLVKVHLTTNKHILSSDIALDQIDGEHHYSQLIEKGEWDENSDLSRRTVFTYIIQNPKQGSRWSLKHGCHTEKPSDCEFFLVVTGQYSMFGPQTTGMVFSSQQITIDVSTSAERGHVDMSQQGFKMVPFAIYAKIEMNQQRVLGLEKVTAMVRLEGAHDSHISYWIIPLSDDGRGQPDVAGRDGIYSAVFTPAEDGLYRVSVSAIGETGLGVNFQDMTIVNHIGSLMPRDQLSLGCKNSSKPRCLSAVPRGNFVRVQDMAGTVAVENAATFKPGKPMKILDFMVTVLPDYLVEFSFTSPKLYGSEDSPDEFRFYMAPHVDNFLDSTDLTAHLMTSRGEAPGTHVILPYNAQESAIPYYAVEAIYHGQRSGPSNVVGVLTGEKIPPTEPTAPTTQSPTSTEIPTTPETEEPTTPETESPTTPETEEPTTPETESPTTTETESPTTTETESPTTTETESPTTPETEEPTTPIWETTTTGSPLPTTTDESEESDETSTPVPTTTPTTTTEESGSSTTTRTTTENPPPTTSKSPPVATSTEEGGSTTEPPASTTEGDTTTESHSSTTEFQRWSAVADSPSSTIFPAEFITSTEESSSTTTSTLAKLITITEGSSTTSLPLIEITTASESSTKPSSGTLVYTKDSSSTTSPMEGAGPTLASIELMSTTENSTPLPTESTITADFSSTSASTEEIASATVSSPPTMQISSLTREESETTTSFTTEITSTTEEFSTPQPNIIVSSMEEHITSMSTRAEVTASSTEEIFILAAETSTSTSVLTESITSASEGATSTSRTIDIMGMAEEGSTSMRPAAEFMLATERTISTTEPTEILSMSGEGSTTSSSSVEITLTTEEGTTTAPHPIEIISTTIEDGSTSTPPSAEIVSVIEDASTTSSPLASTTEEGFTSTPPQVEITSTMEEGSTSTPPPAEMTSTTEDGSTSILPPAKMTSTAEDGSTSTPPPAEMASIVEAGSTSKLPSLEITLTTEEGPTSTQPPIELTSTMGEGSTSTLPPMESTSHYGFTSTPLPLEIWPALEDGSTSTPLPIEITADNGSTSTATSKELTSTTEGGSTSSQPPLDITLTTEEGSTSTQPPLDITLTTGEGPISTQPPIELTSTMGEGSTSTPASIISSTTEDGSATTSPPSKISSTADNEAATSPFPKEDTTTTEGSTSTTGVTSELNPSSSSTTELASSSSSETSLSATPEPPASSLSTSEQGSGDTTPSNVSFKIASSETLLCILTLCSFFYQRIFT